MALKEYEEDVDKWDELSRITVEPMIETEDRLRECENIELLQEAEKILKAKDL